MSEPNIEQLTRVHHKIKAKRDEITAAFKKEDNGLAEQQKEIKSALLSIFKENGSQSITTEAGRVTRSVKTKYWTSDWEEMYKFVKEHDVPEFFSKSLNQTNVKAFMEENPNIIPKGLNVDSEYSISIYKPTKKRGE